PGGRAGQLVQRALGAGAEAVEQQALVDGAGDALQLQLGVGLHGGGAGEVAQGERVGDAQDAGADGDVAAVAGAEGERDGVGGLGDSPVMSLAAVRRPAATPKVTSSPLTGLRPPCQLLALLQWVSVRAPPVQTREAGLSRVSSASRASWTLRGAALRLPAVR